MHFFVLHIEMDQLESRFHSNSECFLTGVYEVGFVGVTVRQI